MAQNSEEQYGSVDYDPLDETRMPLGDHLEELRKRLIMGLIGPVVTMVICLIYGGEIMAFIAKPLMIALEYNGLDAKVYVASPTAAIITYIKIGLLGGLIVGSPWLLWQMWKFISAGLYPHEKNFVRVLVPGSAILTTLGLAFLYYIMLPVCLGFLIHFSTSFGEINVERSYLNDKLIETTIGKGENPIAEVNNGFAAIPILRTHPENPKPGQIWMKIPENLIRLQTSEKTYLEWVPQAKGFIQPEIRLDEYISFVMLLALAFTIGFQTPLVLFLLGKTGLVNHKQLGRMRKYAVLVCMVLGAFLTPQDPISMVLLAVPLYVLYEFGMLMMRFSEKKRDAEAEEDDFSWDKVWGDSDDSEEHDDDDDHPHHDDDGHWHDDGHDYDSDYQDPAHDSYHDYDSYHDHDHYYDYDEVSDDGDGDDVDLGPEPVDQVTEDDGDGDDITLTNDQATTTTSDDNDDEISIQRDENAVSRSDTQDQTPDENNTIQSDSDQSSGDAPNPYSDDHPEEKPDQDTDNIDDSDHDQKPDKKPD